jgi:hypothetical protein
MPSCEPEPPRKPDPPRPTECVKTLLQREDLLIGIMAGLLAWVITLGLKMGFAGL